MLSLRRPKEGRVVAGVCAGLAKHFGVTALGMRIIFVLGTLMFEGIVPFTYIVLFFLLPEEEVEV